MSMHTSDIRVLADFLRKNRLLGEHTRLIIMILLYLNGRMKFTELQRILGLTPGNLAGHIRKLREKGYIRVRKTYILELRPATIIEITPEGAKELLAFMRKLSDLLEYMKKKERSYNNLDSS